MTTTAGDKGFRDLELDGYYDSTDDPLHRFYVPVLGAAVAYDRAVGYWSARELVYAARGVARFIARDGVMRLLVGAELHEDEVQAIMGGEALEAVVAANLIADPLGAGVGIVEQHYLQVLSYLAREGRLHVKVGVPVDGDGLPMTYQESQKYFHTKYGILTDPAGDKIAFIGSNNATAPGWQANHETFSVFQSWRWNGEVWTHHAAPFEQQFEALWEGSPGGGWAALDLPEAVAQQLIEYAQHDYAPPLTDPGEDLNEADEQPGHEPDLDVDAARERLRQIKNAPTVDGGTFVGAVTAPVVPLPHQTRIMHRAVTTYPRGYLLADEVGLGKTIEAGLILRELLLAERAQTALLLVPASVLTQWQEELWEKLALRVPRFDGKRFLDVDGTELEAHAGSPWNAHPVLLASSHLARRKARRREILDAGPWDIVLVDEAHHARRRGSKATDTPNTLLALLQEMKRDGSWNALYLASATPMQMHAHEAWDLLALFGLPGLWSRDAAQFHAYYQALREPPQSRNWSLLQRMLEDYLNQPDVEPDPALKRDARNALGHARARLITDLHRRAITQAKAAELSPLERELTDRWLRHHTPMRDRVFRTTRQTMRDYQAAGILDEDVTIPERKVYDEFIKLSDDERRMYERIEDYISRHYNAYMQGQQKALGFIMTVYRRRLTSSFAAIRSSLLRRLAALEQGLSLQALLDEDDQRAVEDATLDFEGGDRLERNTADLLVGEIDELRSFLDSLERLSVDSKTNQLTDDITETLLTHDTVVVFTQYTDTMDYLRDQLARQYGRIACYSGRGGELWNPETEAWVPVTKARLKALFREGKEVKILIGTDSMSEGLNLQTSGRLINVDMPWNFMRVEQRIGRVDRIGGQPVVEVSNYFYEKTVEEQVYRGIAEDYDWFTAIVGDAQPVLAAVEDAMSKAAMAPAAEREDVIALQVQSVTDAVEASLSRDVKISDIADTTIEPPPDLEPVITLEDIRAELTVNPLTKPRLYPDPELDGVYQLTLDDGLARVSFDREVVDQASVPVQLLTYGTRALDELLNS